MSYAKPSGTIFTHLVFGDLVESPYLFEIVGDGGTIRTCDRLLRRHKIHNNYLVISSTKINSLHCFSTTFLIFMVVRFIGSDRLNTKPSGTIFTQYEVNKISLFDLISCLTSIKSLPHIGTFLSTFNHILKNNFERIWGIYEMVYSHHYSFGR